MKRRTWRITIRPKYIPTTVYPRISSSPSPPVIQWEYSTEYIPEYSRNSVRTTTTRPKNQMEQRYKTWWNPPSTKLHQRWGEGKFEPWWIFCITDINSYIHILFRTYISFEKNWLILATNTLACGWYLCIQQQQQQTQGENYLQQEVITNGRKNCVKKRWQ